MLSNARTITSSLPVEAVSGFSFNPETSTHSHGIGRNILCRGMIGVGHGVNACEHSEVPCIGAACRNDNGARCLVYDRTEWTCKTDGWYSVGLGKSCGWSSAAEINNEVERTYSR